MATRLTGLNPLAYLGVEPSMPAQFITDTRNPTPTDYQNFNIGTVWINKDSNAVFMLVDKAGGTSTWVEFTSETTDLNSLTGDSGGAVPPTTGNINVIGNPGSPYAVTGNPATSTLSIDDNGTVLTQADGNLGFAVPIGNTLRIEGTGQITTGGIGDLLFISLLNGADGQLLIGGGADPVWANLTSTGGTVSITNGPNSINLEVAGAVSNIEDLTGDTGTATGTSVEIAGGNNITTAAAGATVTVNVDGVTEDSLVVGNASGSLDSLGVATNGQIPIGSTGTTPVLATITAGANITVTNTAGGIEISGSGAMGSGVIVTPYTSSGMWTKDANTKVVTIYIWNGGYGGWGGGIDTFGRGGCPGGAAWYYNLPADIFGPSETVTIGAGGAGGLGQAAAASNPGSIGGRSWVGSLTPTEAFVSGGFPIAPPMWSFGTPDSVYTANPQSGPGGRSGGTGGGAGTSTGQDIGSSSSLTGSSISGRYPSGSGGGAGAFSAGSPDGSRGGNIYALDNATLIYAGGAGGVASNGSNGVNGFTSAAGGVLAPGTGGGGGAYDAGTGFNGGDGGYNSGGGGGGAGGTMGGDGGSGGDGYVLIFEFI